MMTLKVGDTIKVDEKHHGTLDMLTDDINDATIAFSTASRLLRTSQEKLWEYIREAVPEAQEAELRYDNGKKELVVMDSCEARMERIRREARSFED